MVQVDVGCRNDERDGSYDLSVRLFYRSGNQPVPDEIAERFRPVRVALRGDQLIEARQKIRVDRYANAA